MTFSGNKVIFKLLEKVILEVEQSSLSLLEKDENQEDFKRIHWRGSV